MRERRAVSAQQQMAQTELQHRTQQLEQREAEIDARENALGQLQAELRKTQREVLEMRLATEETWAQLSGALAPASLTRSISQVRAKMADHYRMTLEELAGRSQQLERCRGDLTQQLQSLESQRAELARGRSGGMRILNRRRRGWCRGSRSSIGSSRITSRWNRSGTSSGPTTRRKFAGYWPRFAIWKWKKCGRRDGSAHAAGDRIGLCYRDCGRCRVLVFHRRFCFRGRFVGFVSVVLRTSLLFWTWRLFRRGLSWRRVFVGVGFGEALGLVGVGHAGANLVGREIRRRDRCCGGCLKVSRAS